MSATRAPQSFRPTEDFVVTNGDARADGGLRSIRFVDKAVRISRERDGIAMRIAVPYTAYRGLALGVAQSASKPRFAIMLVHDDADLSVTIASFECEATARRVWIETTQLLGVARLKQGAKGGAETLDTPLGAARFAPPSARRRGGAIRTRRSRFSQRRRCGNRFGVAAIYRGEREIIARN